MSSVCKLIGAFVTLWALFASAPMAQSPLRVCADPNNMPFSNTHGDGFENRIATLVARELRRPLEYYWLPQRRGFMRNSDVIDHAGHDHGMRFADSRKKGLRGRCDDRRIGPLHQFSRRQILQTPFPAGQRLR